ncbi:MAG: PadR family transcriptional regulator [Planctomycetota bacterium]|jgi:PadR family transcriptional regulator PadR
MKTKFFKNWTNQARKGLLELTILNDIRNRRMYGYEIERKFRKFEGLLMSEGTIYNILRRLKQQRLVKTIQTRSPDGPKRKYYQLTKLGRQTLAQMNGYWRAIKKQADSIEQGK